MLGDLTDVESSINTNSTNITSNDTDIASNATNITTNSSAISTLNNTTLANFSSGARVYVDGSENIGIGSDTLSSISGSAQKNTAVGYQALAGLTTGKSNTAIGNTALNVLTTGGENTALGYGRFSFHYNWRLQHFCWEG